MLEARGSVFRVRHATIVLAAICILGSACAKTPAAPASPSVSADPQRTEWDSANLHDYTWTVELSCFCAPLRYTVEVVNGEPTHVSLNGADTDPDSKDASWLPLTVEDLFAQRDEAYARDAVEVDVTYDAHLGYPKHLYVDQSRNMADEEMGYTVTSFEPAG